MYGAAHEHGPRITLNQLIAAADAHADGRVTWQDGEGGLQHVEEHVNNILRG